ncbi:hypothetical protein [Rhodophyticola sp.]|jgi:hypothetical protein|uniref:hypothetical protein n=1 Tax=Rhodophyticola sp. TaxID=2680032 RepID=UPI003D2763E8
MNDDKKLLEPSRLPLETESPSDDALRKRIGDPLYAALMDGMEPEDVLAALDAERAYFLSQVNSPKFE